METETMSKELFTFNLLCRTEGSYAKTNKPKNCISTTCKAFISRMQAAKLTNMGGPDCDVGV